MGNRFEVWAWVRREGEYEYVQTWRGESLLRAIFEMRRARKTSGCVRLEWR